LTAEKYNTHSETDQEALGSHYMDLAIQYGFIELQKDLTLYTIDALEAENPGHIKSFLAKTQRFYL
jgi:hypothetical protein